MDLKWVRGGHLAEVGEFPFAQGDSLFIFACIMIHLGPHHTVLGALEQFSEIWIVLSALVSYPIIPITVLSYYNYMAGRHYFDLVFMLWCKQFWTVNFGCGTRPACNVLLSSRFFDASVSFASSASHFPISGPQR
jgi:hypothetical protein